jgi:L,D-transpeptidase YcbB
LGKEDTIRTALGHYSPTELTNRRTLSPFTYVTASLRKLPLGIFVFLAVGVSACHLGKSSKDTHLATVSIPLPEIEIDGQQLNDAIRRVFSSDTAILRARIKYSDTLATFYRKRDFAPLWTSAGPESPDALRIMQSIARSGEHGLNPAWYGYPFISQSYETCMSRLRNDSAVDYRALASFDIALSAALIDYIRHLKYGIVNPLSIDSETYTIPVKPRNSSLFEPLNTEDLEAELERARPKSERYLKLQQALKYYEWLAESGGWQPIPVIDAKWKPGDSIPNLELIMRRVAVTGREGWLRWLAQKVTSILPDASFSPPDLYKLDWDRIRTNIYDTTLTPLIVEYQKQNGLLPDGVIGKRTIENMNIPVADRIQQIKLTLERFRWTDYPDTGRFVLVNVPDFYLYAYDKGAEQFRIKVCVGMRYRGARINGIAPNYQTPQIKGTLSFLVMNPTWSVPQSIAARETYKEAVKNPKYLLRYNYRVYIKDSLVDPSSINWSKYRADNLPFRFVQGAGAGNALGKLKFVFDNPFDVYLHDTPKRVPFTYATRTVSHGCIRVEEPKVLMSFLFKDHSTWDAAKVLSYIQMTSETKWVPIEKKATVIVDYFTSWVDKDSRIHLREDVYGKDARLKRAILAYR